MKTIDDFLAAQKARGLASATMRALRSDLSNFVSWWEQIRQRPFSLQQLVSRDIRRWQTHRQQNDGVAPKTLNRNLFSLRRFCQWAVTQGLLPDNPAAAVTEIPENDLVPRFLTDTAVDALARAPRQIPDRRLRLRDQALLALLLYAGLRSQEACDVQLRDVDLAGGNLTVRQGKGRKARRVPLHSEAHDWLARYLDEIRCPEGMPPLGSDRERTPLLLGVRMTAPGQPMQAGIKTRAIRKRITQLGQIAAEQLEQDANDTTDVTQARRLRQAAQELRQVSAHQLRHSLARRLLQNGAQLVEVQRILGHSRLSTTGMYLLPSETDLRQAMERSGI
jgi:integrase/recombinase XerC